MTWSCLGLVDIKQLAVELPLSGRITRFSRKKSSDWHKASVGFSGLLLTIVKEVSCLVCHFFITYVKSKPSQS